VAVYPWLMQFRLFRFRDDGGINREKQ